MRGISAITYAALTLSACRTPPPNEPVETVISGTRAYKIIDTKFDGALVKLVVVHLDRCTRPNVFQPYECHAGPAARLPVVLTWAQGSRLETLSDERGAFDLNFLESTEADIRALDDGSAALSIGGKNLPFEVWDGITDKLLAGAKADPNSRINREVASRAEADCRARISAATQQEQGIDTDPDAVEQGWRDAKRACDSRWKQEDQDHLAATAVRIAASRCALAEQAANRLVEALPASPNPDLHDIEGSLDRFGAICDGHAAAMAAPALRVRAAAELSKKAATAIKAADLTFASAALDAAASLDPNNKSVAPTRVQIERAEAREQARSEAKERELARREGPVWQVEAICVGQGVIASASVRANSKAKAFEKACADFCAEYPRSIIDDCQTSCSLGWVMTMTGKVQDVSVCSVHAGRE